MKFLTEPVKTIYFKYLAAAFGSALIASIYSLVDMAMVGKYQGPEGTAALAVVAPIWNIVYSLGLLMGIGGSVLFGTLRGRGAEETRSNEYFSAAVLGGAVLAAAVWLGLLFFDRELLILFGARGDLLPLARQYVLPIKFAVPAFLFDNILSAFLRSDGNPGLAAKAVLAGGLLNIFGDYFCVFTLDMGMMGAGLATALGALCTCLLMLTHFLSRRNTLRLVRPVRPLEKLWKITAAGFSTFFVDIAMGLLTVLFNLQILRYLDGSALAVYGIIINISTIVQCCAYSVGQAAQPILSVNFGAGKGRRIREALGYALGTTAFFALAWTALSLAAPNAYIRLFMSPTPEVLAVAPAIIRTYSLSFLLLPFNIFSTYYFQALMRPAAAFVVSIARGAAVSGALIFLLPLAAGPAAIWFAMPITEAVTAVYAMTELVRRTRALPE